LSFLGVILPLACVKRFFFFMLFYATLSLTFNHRKLLLLSSLGLSVVRPVFRFSRWVDGFLFALARLLKVPLPSSFG
jgi:hypothetical protein